MFTPLRFLRCRLDENGYIKKVPAPVGAMVGMTAEPVTTTINEVTVQVRRYPARLGPLVAELIEIQYPSDPEGCLDKEQSLHVFGPEVQKRELAKIKEELAQLSADPNTFPPILERYRKDSEELAEAIHQQWGE